MKFLIPFIILIAVFQSSFFPASLILAFIIAKSYSHSELNDYFLSLVGGVSIGLFQSSNIGFQTISLTLAVLATHLYRKSPFSTNLLFFIPFTSLLIFLLNMFQAIFQNNSIDYSAIIFESIICTLTFSLIRALGLIGREKHSLRLKL